MITNSLREQAIKIWQAGVHAVDSTKLIHNVIEQTENGLTIAGYHWDFTNDNRICVIGGGKAGAGMASAFESCLKDDWKAQVFGWVNIPDDCVRELETIHLHGARPAGLNEPTEAGVEGVREILECVETLGENDLCVVLISGGGSALLPYPVDGITLEEKQALTRSLMQNGATIQELNTVRRAISKIKGGGLLRACRAGRLISLIISDVVDDQLETIASGPTVDIQSDPAAALNTLNEISDRSEFVTPQNVINVLKSLIDENQKRVTVTLEYSNHIIGNNRTAVEAAAEEAEKLGYSIKLKEADQVGEAKVIGKEFTEQLLRDYSDAESPKKTCYISGGEPTVTLVPFEGERKGGRNQELVLAAAKVLEETERSGIIILSGGTDGEDGPTDSAGAMIDSEFLGAARANDLNINDYLSINNSYPFFDQIGGLIKTGPTHTNVMDLRIGLIEK